MDTTTIIIHREPSPFPKEAPYVYRAYMVMPEDYIDPGYHFPLHMGNYNIEDLIKDVKTHLSHYNLEFVLPKEGKVFTGITLTELAEQIKKAGY